MREIVGLTHHRLAMGRASMDRSYGGMKSAPEILSKRRASWLSQTLNRYRQGGSREKSSAHNESEKSRELHLE